MALPAPAEPQPPASKLPASAPRRRRGRGPARPVVATPASVESLTGCGAEAAAPAQVEPSTSLASRNAMRSLLERDRQQLGDGRRFGERARLTTAAYRPPLAARWHAFKLAHWYWFHGAGAVRLQRAGVLALATCLLTCLGWLAWAWLGPANVGGEAAGASPAAPEKASGSRAEVTTVAPASRAGRSATQPSRPQRLGAASDSADAELPGKPRRLEVAAAAHEPSAGTGDRGPSEASAAAADGDAKLERWLRELSPRARVVRADALLRNPHLPPARRARGLLESVVDADLDGAHTQAALAEACLRLEDFACARRAVREAIRLRPWRGGYRSLQRRIENAAP